MINYETIISNFDDKVTLYNWLRKVEEALKNASATNFVVNKKGNATLSFSITFADGETLESGDIVLQQGESVDQARIASGILQLHLTNGTWLTAGNIKPVSNFNIDENQHLIVNYQDGTSQDLGAIFNGNVHIAGTLTADVVDGVQVTGNEIVEKMTYGSYAGYLFTKPSEVENLTKEFIYAGVVKNGNKLTFVIAVNLTRTGDISQGDKGMGTFVVPVSVGDKLYPTNIGGVDFLAVADIPAVISQGNVEKVSTYTLKHYSNNVEVDFTRGSLQNLTLNQKYYVRYEATFLLSQNLAE